MNKKSILLVAISVAFSIGIVSFVIFQQGVAEVSSYDGPPKAVIIDQLYDDMPNESFHQMATSYLVEAGYQVDIVTTKDVTVDFYKNLPKMNYKYVVIRTHGAENADDVVLFTGEKYSEEQYIQEQLFGQVKKATPLLELAYKVDDADGSSDWVIVNETTRYLSILAKPVDQTRNEYFAISPKLVKDAMNGRFDDTVFVLGGCNTMSNPSLAKSLIDRGSSMVLGWDDAVGNADNDRFMLFFLENILVRNADIDEVLNNLPPYLKPEKMSYPANFEHYT